MRTDPVMKFIDVSTAPRRNTVVFGGFASVAVVGVAGVLAFSVTARTREFGIRLAIGSQRRQILGSFIKEVAAMADMSIIAGAIGRFVLARGAASYLSDLQMPGFMPVIVAGFVLLLAAMIASALPAARAALIDAMEALQTD